MVGVHPGFCSNVATATSIDLFISPEEILLVEPPAFLTSSESSTADLAKELEELPKALQVRRWAKRHEFGRLAWPRNIRNQPNQPSLPWSSLVTAA